MSGKLDRKTETRFKTYLEANHYIKNKSIKGNGDRCKYTSTLTGYHVAVMRKQNIIITKRLIREVRQDLERNGYECIPY